MVIGAAQEFIEGVTLPLARGYEDGHGAGEVARGVHNLATVVRDAIRLRTVENMPEAVGQFAGRLVADVRDNLLQNVCWYLTLSAVGSLSPTILALGFVVGAAGGTSTWPQRTAAPASVVDDDDDEEDEGVPSPTLFDRAQPLLGKASTVAHELRTRASDKEHYAAYIAGLAILLRHVNHRVGPDGLLDLINFAAAGAVGLIVGDRLTGWPRHEG